MVGTNDIARPLPSKDVAPLFEPLVFFAELVQLGKTALSLAQAVPD